LALSVVITASSVTNLQARNGLPLINQVSGWAVLITASLFPLIYPARHSDPSSKILSFFLAFAVCFVILSISVEGLFYLSYSAVLILWIEVEAVLRGADRKVTEKGWYKPQADDLRIALFFLFFVQVAFFGTGK
jgi:phosphatidylinositol glycan class N